MTTRRAGTLPFRDAAEILLLGALLMAPQLLFRETWGPDETRFAEVAREMVSGDDYLLPHLNGEIYPEKPPLYFWCAAALRAIFGADAGRVVSMAAALASLLLIYGIGRRLYGRPSTGSGREEGLWAARIAATMLLFLGLGSAGTLDSMLLAAILAAIACGLAALDEPGPRAGAWWLGAYAAASAAVLTKGPIGLAIPAIVLFAHGAACRRQVRAGGWWHLLGTLLMLALIAAWVVPACLRGGPEYARKIILQQTLERVGSSAIHGEPSYYYLVRWPLFLWPWSLLVPLALAAALRAAWRPSTSSGRPEPVEGRGGAWRAALPALWFLAVFVFLSLISGKRERYFLPAVPAAALACARYLCSARAGAVPWPRWHQGLLAATWLCFLVLGASLAAAGLAPGAVLRTLVKDPAALQDFREAFTGARAAAAATLGGGLCAMGLLGLLWAWRPSTGSGRHGGMLVAAVVALALSFDLLAIPTINRFKSDRRVVAHFMPYLDQAEELYLFRTEFDGIFNLYAGKTHIPVIRPPDAPEQAAERLASSRRVAIAAWNNQVEKLNPAERYQVITSCPGSLRNLVLLVNWKPEPPAVAGDSR